MRKFIKKTMALMLAAVMMVGIGENTVEAASSQGFALKYYSTAPSTVNKLWLNRTITASGKEYVRVKVSNFSLTRTGGYMRAAGTNYSTTPKNFTSETTKKVYFTGQTIPKKGEAVTVQVSLVNYASALSLVSEGTVMQ